MKSLLWGLSFGSLLVSSTAFAGADAEPDVDPKIETGARLGYGLPFGSFERGTRVRDLSYGTVLFGLDASVHLTESVQAGVVFAYGVAIPKLCITTSDCKSSLGSDVMLALVGRFALPKAGPVFLELEAGPGYAWYTRRLSDGQVSTSRGYRGPIGVLGAEAALELSPAWRLGLLLELIGGFVTSTKLDAEGFSRRDSADGPTLSGMFFVGPRISKTW